MDFRKTSILISKFFFPSNLRYGKTSGICFSPSTLNGSSASVVIIQGEIEVAKFLPLKGPSGTYSNF
jgi:hypothetical protein